MPSEKLRVALVGCGQIADAHLQEIQRIASADLVAVCDRHLDLAQQAAARFKVPGAFADFDHMLAKARPDVVHITTPPQTHHPLALRALAAGLHVYLEKPFTIDVSEADHLLAVAEAKNRLVCVGHDQLFDPAWEQCRQLYRSGALGQVVHVDSVLAYDLEGPFGKVVSSEADHWVRHLPGGLFHNTISHALYKITEFLADAQPRIWATWFSRSERQRFQTELRVSFQGVEATATLLFTSSVRPPQGVTRIYGTRQCIEVDLDGRLVRCRQPPALRGPLVKLEIPWKHLCEASRSFGRNLLRFGRGDLQYFAGMNRLFTLFYRAILQRGQPPIPYAEIRRVTAIMDQIFHCCQAEHDQHVSLTARNGAPRAHAGADRLNAIGVGGRVF
jgi:predicted dehydrogenase